MGIRVGHDADAEVIGQLALATGQGQYNKWLYEQQQQERMQQQRLDAQINAQLMAQQNARVDQRAWERDQKRQFGIGMSDRDMRYEQNHARITHDYSRVPQEYVPPPTPWELKQQEDQAKWDDFVRKEEYRKKTWDEKFGQRGDEWDRKQGYKAEEWDRQHGIGSEEWDRRKALSTLTEDLQNGSYPPDAAGRIQKIQADLQAVQSAPLRQSEKAQQIAELQAKLQNEVQYRIPKNAQQDAPIIWTHPETNKQYIKTGKDSWAPFEDKKQPEEKPAVSMSDYMAAHKQAVEILSRRVDANGIPIPPSDADIEAQADKLLSGYLTKFGKKKAEVATPRGTPATMDGGAADDSQLPPEQPPAPAVPQRGDKYDMMQEAALAHPVVQQVIKSPITPEIIAAAKPMIDEMKRMGATREEILLALAKKATGQPEAPTSAPAPVQESRYSPPPRMMQLGY